MTRSAIGWRLASDRPATPSMWSTNRSARCSVSLGTFQTPNSSASYLVYNSFSLVTPVQIPATAAFNPACWAQNPSDRQTRWGRKGFIRALEHQSNGGGNDGICSQALLSGGLCQWTPPKWTSFSPNGLIGNQNQGALRPFVEQSEVMSCLWPKQPPR